MHVACIRTHLISSASTVSLVPRPEDRTRLLSSSLRSFSGPPSSPSLFYTGMLGGGWERGYISLARLPQQLLEQHALLSLMSWAYSTCAVFGLLFQQRAGSGVTFDSTFFFEARPLSLREHDCAISTIDPRSFTLRTPGLKFTSGTWLRNISLFSNFSQRDSRYSTNTKFTVRRTNTYTHTYIDTPRVQHVNVGLAQARPNK